MKKKHNYKTLADVIRAMLDGVVFYPPKGHIGETRSFKYTLPVQGQSVPFRFGMYYIQEYWLEWKEWTVESHWYENIPSEGVLCWVKDEVDDECEVDTVILYNTESKDYPFKGRREGWTHATPVKPSECLSDGER